MFLEEAYLYTTTRKDGIVRRGHLCKGVPGFPQIMHPAPHPLTMRKQARNSGCKICRVHCHPNLQTNLQAHGHPNLQTDLQAHGFLPSPTHHTRKAKNCRRRRAIPFSIMRRRLVHMGLFEHRQLAATFHMSVARDSGQRSARRWKSAPREASCEDHGRLCSVSRCTPSMPGKVGAATTTQTSTRCFHVHISDSLSLSIYIYIYIYLSHTYLPYLT